MTSPGMVTRKATGLVRAVGPTGVFAFGMFALNLGLPVTYMMLFVPAFYPGADLGVSILLAGVLSIFVAIMYWTLSVSMPRSGGDYVFNTRTLHPSIGFAFSWAYVFFPLFYTSWAAWAMTTQGLSPLFYVLSVQTGGPMYATLSTALADPVVIFLIGAILLVLTFIVVVTGTRHTFLLTNIVFFAGMLTTVVIIVLMAASTRQGFITNLANLTGVNYQATVDEAVASGFVPNATFDWTSTINSMVWPWFMFPFAVQSVFFAGEIKDIRKSELIGIVGSTAFSIVVCLLIWYLALRTFGYEFLGAVGWTGAFPVFPQLNLLAALLTDNPVLAAVAAASLVLWPYGWFFTGLLPGSRSMFAWGIDRVVPETVTKVSAKWHTPTVAYGLSTVIALIFLAGISFTTWFGTLTGMVGFGLCYMVAGVTGILFPYVLKDIYGKSPAKIEIGGMPLVSLCGVVTLFGSAFLTYRTVVDDFAFANNPMSLATIAAIFILGFVIWIVSYFVRKSQGIDILAAYRELPVE